MISRDARPGDTKWRSVAVVACIYVALALVLFGPFASTGGLLHDDWNFVERYDEFGDGSPLSTAASAIGDGEGDRPVGHFFLGLVYSTLGTAHGSYIALLAALALVVAGLVFGVLRGVRVPVPEAATVGALTILVPASDAIRLWPAAASAQLSLALLLAGALLTLTAFGLPGWRGIALHTFALLSYAASPLVYEATIVAIACMFLLYRLRVSWGQALRRAVFDWILVIGLVVYIQSNTLKSTEAATGTLDRANSLAYDAVVLLGTAGGALYGPRGANLVTLVFLVCAALLAIWAVGPSRAGTSVDSAHARRRWTAMCGGGILLVAIGSVPLVFTIGYTPLGQGVFNRVNVVAGIGCALAMFAFAALSLGFLAERLPAGARLHWNKIPVVAGLLVAVVFGQAFLRDRSDFERAHREQERALEFIATATPHAPPPSVVVAFGTPGEAAPGVPVFGATWDLSGALRVRWHDPDVRAAPQSTLTGVTCGASGVQLDGGLYVPPWRASYEGVVFVNVAQREVVDRLDKTSCHRTVRLWAHELAAGA